MAVAQTILEWDGKQLAIIPYMTTFQMFRDYFQSLRSLSLKDPWVIGQGQLLQKREWEEWLRTGYGKRRDCVCYQLATHLPTKCKVASKGRRWAVSLLVHIICHGSSSVCRGRDTPVSMQSLSLDQQYLCTLTALLFLLVNVAENGCPAGLQFHQCSWKLKLKSNPRIQI